MEFQKRNEAPASLVLLKEPDHDLLPQTVLKFKHGPPSRNRKTPGKHSDTFMNFFFLKPHMHEITVNYLYKSLTYQYISILSNQQV